MAIRPELRAELMALPPAERIELADALYSSVEDNGVTDPDWEAAWADELRRRVQGIREGDVQGVPAEQVHADVLAQLNASEQG